MTRLIELKEAWLAHLAREYMYICRERRLSLTMPLLRLSQGKTRLGYWSADRKEICINEELILEYPWHVVLQVFKHEIAHQICDELFEAKITAQSDQPVHGTEFRRACTLLGLDALFQQRDIDLASYLPLALQNESAGGDHSRLLTRIQKLLALGHSANEHEASLALQRAQELVAKHHLDLDGLAEEKKLIHRSIVTGLKVIPLYRIRICSLLTEFFSVRCIIGTSYQPRQDSSVKTIELLGQRQHVAAAMHCYFFLEERLQALWQNQSPLFSGTIRSAKNSYYLGLIEGFRQSLGQKKEHVEKPHATADMTAHSLLALHQQELDLFVHSCFPKLSKRRFSSASIRRSPYELALLQGKRLRLRRPIQEGQGQAALPYHPNSSQKN